MCSPECHSGLYMISVKSEKQPVQETKIQMRLSSNVSAPVLFYFKDLKKIKQRLCKTVITLKEKASEFVFTSVHFRNQRLIGPNFFLSICNEYLQLDVELKIIHVPRSQVVCVC